MGVQVFVSLLRKFWPLAPLADGQRALTHDERARFTRWETAVYGPVIFVFVPTLMVAWFYSLEAASGAASQNPSGTLLLIRAAPIYWTLPAIPLGILSAARPTRWWARCLLGDRADRFHRACNEKSGVEWGRALRVLMGISLVGTLVYAASVLHYYVRLDRTGVEIGRHWSLSREFAPYRSIRRIEHHATWVNPSGRRIASSHYIFDFEAIPSWTLGSEYDIAPLGLTQVA